MLHVMWKTAEVHENSLDEEIEHLYLRNTAITNILFLHLISAEYTTRPVDC